MPSTYPLKKLWEICDIITWSTPPTKYQEYYGGDFLRACPADLDQWNLTIQTNKTLSPQWVKEGKIRIIPKWAVMVCCIWTIGKCSVASQDMATNQQINSFIPKEDILDSKYLLYSVKFHEDIFKTKATSTTVPILNKSQCAEILIPLPPLATQRTIATKLDKLQSLIDLKKQSIAKTDDLAKSIFLEMFGDPMTNEKCREAKTLNDITTITMGQSPDWESYNEDGFWIPFFQWKAEFTDKYPIVKKWTTKPTKQAKINDILMSVRAPVWDINLCNIDCCIGRWLASIRVKDVSLYYLYAILWHLKESISDLWTWSTFKAISSQQLKNLNIICPPFSLQQKFADIITEIESQKSAHKEALAKLENLYHSEMQRSFSMEL